MCQQDDGFSERLSISDFVEHVRIGRRNLRDHNLGMFNLPLHILKDDTRASLLIYSDDLKARGVGLLEDNLSIERVKGFREFHGDECSRPVALNIEFGECNDLVSSSDEPYLSAFQRLSEHVLRHRHLIHQEADFLALNLQFQ